VKKQIAVLKDVTEANAILAGSLRAEFARQGVLVLDFVASPGAGKTSILERSIERLAGELRLAVIEGDPYTTLDADRIGGAGVPAVQINTGGGCHLEAHMIHEALGQVDVGDVDVLIVENVGNLLCPAGWDLGEDAKVVVASLPEGDDKPLKYPQAFQNAQVMLINKVDLEPYLPASAAVLRANGLTVNPRLDVFALSAVTGEGFDPWLDWVRRRAAEKRAAAHA
jgi:hydrogenase nickel incorporation protein HypB